MKARAGEQPVMVRRVTAAQATLDRWKDVPFQWGKADCATMIAGHLRSLGLKLRIGKAGSYKTALSARAALKRAGFESVAAAMDAHGFVRIPPAAAVVGDILMLSGDPDDNALGFDALSVAMGNGRVLCWHPDAEGAVVCQPPPIMLVTAWAVL